MRRPPDDEPSASVLKTPTRHPLMSLSIYCLNYSPEPIGIARYNTSMAQWLGDRAGWRVMVRTGIPHYPWWGLPPSASLEEFLHGRGDRRYGNVDVERCMHFIPAPPVTGAKRMRLDASWLLSTWCHSWVARRRPSALLVVAPPFLAGLLGLFLGWRWKIPVIYHVQDLQVDAAADLKMIQSSLVLLLRWIEVFILSRVDLAISISPTMVRRLQAKAQTRRRIRLLPNGIISDKGAELADAFPGFRARWGAAPDTVVVMYSGNLGRKQGFEILIEAIARIKPGLDIWTVIAGDGAERAALEAHSRGLNLTRLLFCGLVEAELLAEFLAAADIHVIPQRRAAAGSVMPSKLLNIMAAGRPVVVTADANTDLARSVIAAGAGLVVEPEDPDSLARAIERLAYNRKEREDCGASARQYVHARYGIDRVLGAFAQAVTTIVRRRRSTRAAWGR